MMLNQNTSIGSVGITFPNAVLFFGILPTPTPVCLGHFGIGAGMGDEPSVAAVPPQVGPQVPFVVPSDTSNEDQNWVFLACTVLCICSI